MTDFSQRKATRPISEVIIHCTATPEGRDVSVDTIRGWHKAQGWNDIGYHWVVLLDGTVKPGRPEAIVGAHVAGHNIGTLGVVYVGGVAKDGKTAKDTRTPAQKAALLVHVKALIERYPTIRKVTGHNQYAAKACPSFDVRKDELGRLFADTKQIVPAPALKPVLTPIRWEDATAVTQNGVTLQKPTPDPEPIDRGFWGRVWNSLFNREP